MQLNKKKELAARTLGVGKDRIVFNVERLDEIKEAITKQDIRDLAQNRAIIVTEIKGSKTKPKRKTRRRDGSIKKRVSQRKRIYMTLTRKFRAYILELKKQEQINNEEYRKLRNEIRASNFRSKAHLKERIVAMAKEREE